MKKVLWIFASALLLSNLFVSTGCGDDENGTGTDLSPIVIITDGPSADVVFDQNATVTVTVEATKGTGALKSVTVLEDGVKVDLDRLAIDGAPAAANPILIVTPSDVMSWEIGVNVQDAYDTREYTVRVEDEKGLSDEITFNVSVKEAVTLITGATIRLANAGGPVGTGGIDLDNGASTGTKFHQPSGDDSYLQAELRDMGIDSLAGSGDNWRRRVAGINGTEVRYLGNTGSLGDFDFADVASKDAVEDYFAAADALTGTLPNWGSFPVSEPVFEGDVFVVYKSTTDRYYLVMVESIVETTSLGDNDDYYQVSIKF